MLILTQFSVFLVNKPGVLAQVTSQLAKAKVNIVALTLADSSEHGVLRFVPDAPESSRKVLASANATFTETEVLAIELANQPGAFSDAAGRLAEEHININYAYCTGGAPGGHTTAIFKVADIKKALKVLEHVKAVNRGGRAVAKAAPGRMR